MTANTINPFYINYLRRLMFHKVNLLYRHVGGAELHHLVDAGLRGGVDEAETALVHIVEDDGGAEVGTLVAEGDVVDVEALDVAGVESVGGCPASELRLGIIGALLAVVFVHQVAGAAAIEVEADIAEPDVTQGLVFHAGDDD